MSKILGNSFVYATVCALLVLPISISLFNGGSLPSFGGGLLPQTDTLLISQSPFPPPPPQTPPARVEVAQSPFPPPPPQTPPARISLGT